MAAKKSRKKKTNESAPTTATEENEATQSAPEAAVAEDTSTAPVDSAVEPTPEDQEPSAPAKKPGITVSRPQPNAQAEASEEVPAATEPTESDKFRPVDIKHPAWKPGEPRIITAMRNIRTKELVIPDRFLRFFEGASEED